MRREKVLVQIGTSIRALRKAQGMTQEALAEKADIHPTYLGQVERGEVNASILTLSAIAGALKLGLAEILPSPGKQGAQQELVAGILAKARALDIEALRLLESLTTEVTDWRRQSSRQGK